VYDLLNIKDAVDFGSLWVWFSSCLLGLHGFLLVKITHRVGVSE